MNPATATEIRIAPPTGEALKSPGIANQAEIFKQLQQSRDELVSGISGGFNRLVTEAPNTDLTQEKESLAGLRGELDELGKATQKRIEEVIGLSGDERKTNETLEVQPLTPQELAELKALEKVNFIPIDTDTHKMPESNSRKRLETVRRENEKRVAIHRKKQDEKFEEDLVKIGQKRPINEGETFIPDVDMTDEKSPEYKAKFAYQNQGLGRLHERIIEDLKFDPAMSKQDSDNLIQQYANRYGFDQKKVQALSEKYNRYMQQRDKVRGVCQPYATKQDLFEAIMGFKPQGNIRLIENPLGVGFVISDEKDYTNAFHTRYRQSEEYRKTQKISGDKEWEACESGGARLIYTNIPDLDNMVIIARPDYQEAIDHEFQHVENKVIMDTEATLDASKLVSADSLADKSPEEQLTGIRDRMFSVRDHRLVAFQDEIFAYLHGGSSYERTQNILTDPNGLYSDSRHISPELLRIYRMNSKNQLTVEQISAIEKQIFGQEFDNIVIEGIAQFRRLREDGYTQEQIRGMLQDQHVKTWKQVVSTQLED